MRRISTWRTSGLALLLAGGLLPAVAQATTLRIESTVMTGLANPRGLALGPDGALYVAEAGTGGDLGTVVVSSGTTAGYGLSGGISRFSGGVQERVASGLPSLAGEGGVEGVGPQDIAFDAAGTLHAVVGLGADPAVRSGALGGLPGADLLGTLVAIEGGTPQLVADLAGFEAAEDPDGAGPDSNPFGLVAQGGGFLVTDAGGNSVLTVDGTDAITDLVVLPPAPNPLPFGPPVYQAVPTGAALTPAGDLVFGQLTGFPFPPGAAQVFGLSGGTLSVLATGFTNLIDVAAGEDGTLYALELDSDSLLGPGTTGSLYAIDADGAASLLLAGLSSPTGLAVGTAGDIFVTVDGFSATAGRVVRLAPVPLPAALPLLLGALGLLAALRLRPGAAV
ncbi:ScyD/ScyE family protein [Rubellimicrobium aerolatum]|uniref:ScyD/ScyE family protein n=1 Tax=Rubellimicrobium aerolatum TaxID=490979 RepID=A0ABW0SA69_9RHOB|nr:ScyD/ScyE family protein [Rubellimicrobium aerolatum]MBP1805206.1 hypothetical protein [Rubellimicrobium aerolatum]